jgi:hypothetical protein
MLSGLVLSHLCRHRVLAASRHPRRRLHLRYPTGLQVPGQGSESKKNTQKNLLFPRSSTDKTVAKGDSEGEGERTGLGKERKEGETW